MSTVLVQTLGFISLYGGKDCSTQREKKSCEEEVTNIKVPLSDKSREGAHVKAGLIIIPNHIEMKSKSVYTNPYFSIASLVHVNVY